MAAPLIDAILDQVVTTLATVATLRPTRTAPASEEEQDGAVIVRIASDAPEVEAERESQSATQRVADVTLMIVAKSDPDSEVPIDKKLLQHWADAINALTGALPTFRTLGAITLWASDYHVFVEDGLSLGELDASVKIVYAHAEGDPTAKAYA
jgi:hypothetical protein